MPLLTLPSPVATLRGHREAVVAHLKSSVPSLRSVEAHGGVFSRASLKRHSLAAPAARVALLGIKRIERDNAGHFIGPAQFGVYVIARGRADEATDHSIDLAEQIAGALDMQKFGTDAAGAAMVESIDILYSEEEKDGIALAAVAFSQEITFGVDRHDEDELSDEWDIGGATWPDNFAVRENEAGGYDPGDKDAL